MMMPTLLATAPPGTPPVLVVPFFLLLVLIAVIPLTTERLRHEWERWYPFVSIGLSVLVGAYYLLRVPAGGTVLQHTLHEYVAFISLIGSLFIVAGGVHLRLGNSAHPWKNVLFLAAGAALANLIGTTGASIVLIRPWIRLNQSRIRAYHLVFFIFVVSNVGGALTPIGDPPLFLGYLQGIPFFWLIRHLWAEWSVALGLLLLVFFVFDSRSFRRIQRGGGSPSTESHGRLHIEGLPNLLLLAALVAAVFLPEKFLLREGVMLAIAAVSLRWTPRAIYRENQFSFGPVKEVAFLFIGIFTTMMPALNYLESNGDRLGITQPFQYYYMTGGLSAVLDNAPTYVNFLKLAEATFVEHADSKRATDMAEGDRRAVSQLLETQPQVIAAISLGAVFFGAMTYIGNGPNFMVKAIAQSAGVPCPDFFGFVFKFSLPILLPILAIAGWTFL